VSGKGLVGCVRGVIIPSLDFEDRADWETRFRGLVKEGSAGFPGVEGIDVFGFDEFN